MQHPETIAPSYLGPSASSSSWLSPAETITILESGDYSSVTALLDLPTAEVSTLLTDYPFLVSTLALGGYYREANILLEKVNTLFASQEPALHPSDPLAPLSTAEPHYPNDHLLFRIGCDQALLTTMLTGDLKGSVRRLRAAVTRANDPFSRAFAQELLGRVLACGCATGFYPKSVMREMRAVCEESIHLWQRAGEPRRAIRALLRLADLYHQSGDLLAAKLVAVEAGRQIAVGDNRVKGPEGFTIEITYRLLEAERHRYTKEHGAKGLEDFFHEAESLVAQATAEGAHLTALTILQSLSRIAPSAGKDPAPLLIEITERAKRVRNRSAAFQASQSLGTLHFSRGELVAARSHFEQALRFGDRAMMPLMQATATLGLLQLTVHQGRFDEAAKLATTIEKLSQEFPITRTALGISAASILAQMGFIDRARQSCVKLLTAVRTQENYHLIGQVLFFLGHLNSLENNWYAAMADWRAARKAHRQAEDIDGHVMTLRALAQGALLEQPHHPRPERPGQLTEASLAPKTSHGLPGTSPSRQRRAIRYLSAAEALLALPSTSSQRTERLIQLGGISLAKAQLLIKIGDQKAALRTLGDARRAYQDAASGKDVALIDSLTGLVLLELARLGNPLLFAEAVGSLGRAAEFLECQQIVHFLWRVRYHQARALFFWGGAESSPQTKLSRWQQADYVMHQAADVLERLKTHGSAAPASALDIIGSGVDESTVFDFGIELNERYLKSSEGAQRWVGRRG